MKKIQILQKATQEEKERTFHWLRIPWDDRIWIARELGLVTEEQLTSVRDPLVLQRTILATAAKQGKLPKIWEAINYFRRKWGEIGMHSKVKPTSKEGGKNGRGKAVRSRRPGKTAR